MSAAESTGRQARRTARRAANSDVLDRLARLGMVSRALLYALIGVLALQIAFGDGGQQADKSGAVATLARQPFGTGVLWVMVFGLAALAVWQFLDAVMGSGRVPDRLEAAGRTAVYLFIVATVLSILVGGRRNEPGDEQSQDLTGWLLGLPGGQFLVGAAGFGLVGLGAGWAYQAVTRRFLDDLRTGELRGMARSLVARLGIAGYLARGAIAGLAGYFVVQAAVDYRPDEAKGMDATLRTFADTPAGPWLLAAVAAGLLLFALYCLCEVRWHRSGPAR